MKNILTDIGNSISLLDPRASDFHARALLIRRDMDSACNEGTITLHQWRLLLASLITLKVKRLSIVGSAEEKPYDSERVCANRS